MPDDDDNDLAREGAPLKAAKAMAAGIRALRKGRAAAIAGPPGAQIDSRSASDLDLANAAITRVQMDEEAAERLPPEALPHISVPDIKPDLADDDSAANGGGERRGKRKRVAGAMPAEKPEVIRYDITIKERASDERPRERLEKMGASALSVTELLAIQLRTGSLEQSALGLAGELLHAFGGLRGIASASREEPCRVKGIGPVKAVEICAAIEMSRRLSVLSADEKPCIRSPQDVSNLLMAEMRDLKKEHLRSLLLDSTSAFQ